MGKRFVFEMNAPISYNIDPWCVNPLCPFFFGGIDVLLSTAWPVWALISFGKNCGQTFAKDNQMKIVFSLQFPDRNFFSFCSFKNLFLFLVIISINASPPTFSQDCVSVLVRPGGGLSQPLDNLSQPGGGTYGRMYGWTYRRTDGRNFPPVFYRISSPIGSAAQKGWDIPLLILFYHYQRSKTQFRGFLEYALRTERRTLGWKLWTRRIQFMRSGASERASVRANECSGAREWSELCRASKWVSGTSEWASRRENGKELYASISEVLYW